MVALQQGEENERVLVLTDQLVDHRMWRQYGAALPSFKVLVSSARRMGT
jgi:hypothetical protein